MLKPLLTAALIVASSVPALAQNDFTLDKGQMLRISPDGKSSIVPMSPNPKMQSAMQKQAKRVTKGLVVWVDQHGRMFYLTNPLNPSWVTGAR